MKSVQFMLYESMAWAYLFRLSGIPVPLCRYSVSSTLLSFVALIMNWIMRTLKSYIAISVDGFIAYPDGDLNWIPHTIRNEFLERYNSADILILGFNTYREIIERNGFWNYQSIKTYVVSRYNSNISEQQDVEFIIGNPISAIRQIKSSSDGEILVMGGGTMVSSLINNNLLNELHLITIPTVLGKGIPFGADVAKMRVTIQTESKGIITTSYHFTQYI